MAKGNLNDEDWCVSLSYDSVNNVDGIAEDYPQGDNKPQISQSHKRCIDPNLGRYVPDASSHTNNHSNVMHHHPNELVRHCLLHRVSSAINDIQPIEGTGSNFSTKDSAYIDGIVRDYPQNDNVIRRYPHKGDHQYLLHRPNSGFLSQHAPFNPNSVIGNDGVTPLESNFEKPMIRPNQGAVSSKSPGMLDGKTNAEVNNKLFRVNDVGNSQRRTIPPLNANHSIMDSRRLQDPNFDINNAMSGSQNNNNNNPMHVLPPGIINQIMHSTHNHNLRPTIRSAQLSLPSGFNQTMQLEHDVLTSPGMGSKRPFSGHHSDYAASLRSSSSPLGVATDGMDPSTPHHAKITPSSLAGFQWLTKSSPHQPQVTLSIPQPCSLTQTISPTQIPQMTPSVPKSHSKRRRTNASKPKDEAMFKFSGIRCCLCNFDLSYDPEIEGLTYPPPGYCILPCGHAFHQICLSSTCIACTAQCCRGEKNMGRDRKLN